MPYFRAKAGSAEAECTFAKRKIKTEKPTSENARLNVPLIPFSPLCSSLLARATTYPLLCTTLLHSKTITSIGWAEALD
jgi:hypothetical protein